MRYKPDWEETQERFVAWWAGEVIDGVAIAVIVRPSCVCGSD